MISFEDISNFNIDNFTSKNNVIFLPRAINESKILNNFIDIPNSVTFIDRISVVDRMRLNKNKVEHISNNNNFSIRGRSIQTVNIIYTNPEEVNYNKIISYLNTLYGCCLNINVILSTKNTYDITFDTIKYFYNNYFSFISYSNNAIDNNPTFFNILSNEYIPEYDNFMYNWYKLISDEL